MDNAGTGQSTGQVTVSNVASALVGARNTRRSVTVRNLDAAITVFIGPVGVTAETGFPLRAGESIAVDTTALIQVLAASGTPKVAFYDTWN